MGVLSFSIQGYTWTPKLGLTSSSHGGTLTGSRSLYLDDHWAEPWPSTWQPRMQTETSESLGAQLLS